MLKISKRGHKLERRYGRGKERGKDRKNKGRNQSEMYAKAKN